MESHSKQSSDDSIEFEIIPPEEYESIGEAYRQGIIASNNIDGGQKTEMGVDSRKSQPVPMVQKETAVVVPPLPPIPAPSIPEHQERYLTAEEVRQEYFGYQDADLPEEQKAAMREYSKKNESSKKYAEALTAMIQRYGLDAIKEKSQEARTECQRMLSALGVSSSPFGNSQTWSMWDLAKQYYFTLHPDQNDSRYSIANPMESPEKFEEIILRHVGWEFYGFPGQMNVIEKITDSNIKIKLLDYLIKEPKENNTLSSKELAELGALLKKAII